MFVYFSHSGFGFLRNLIKYTVTVFISTLPGVCTVIASLITYNISLGITATLEIPEQTHPPFPTGWIIEEETQQLCSSPDAPHVIQGGTRCAHVLCVFPVLVKKPLSACSISCLSHWGKAHSSFFMKTQRCCQETESYSLRRKQLNHLLFSPKYASHTADVLAFFDKLNLRWPPECVAPRGGEGVGVTGQNWDGVSLRAFGSQRNGADLIAPERKESF